MPTTPNTDDSRFHLTALQQEAVISLQNMLPEIATLFEKYGVGHFLKIRLRMERVLGDMLKLGRSDRKNPKAYLKANIEKGLLDLFDEQYDWLIKDSLECGVKRHFAKQVKIGNTLGKTLSFTAKQMHALSKMLSTLLVYKKELTEVLRKDERLLCTHLGALARLEVKSILKNINNIFGCMYKDYKAVSGRHKLSRRTLKKSVLDITHAFNLHKSDGKYAFRVSSIIIPSQFDLKLDVDIEEVSRTLEGIQFNEVIIRNSAGNSGRKITLESCRGRVALRLQKAKEMSSKEYKSELTTQECPELEVSIQGSNFRSIEATGGSKALLATDVHVDSMAIEGNHEIVAFNSCVFGKLALNKGSINNLIIVECRAKMSFSDFSVSEMEITGESTCSLIAKKTEVGRLKLFDSSVSSYFLSSTISSLILRNLVNSARPSHSLIAGKNTNIRTVEEEVTEGAVSGDLERIDTKNGCSLIVSTSLRGRESDIQCDANTKKMGALINESDLSIIHRYLSKQMSLKGVGGLNKLWDALAIFMIALGKNPMNTIWGAQGICITAARYADASSREKLVNQYLFRQLEKFILWRISAYPRTSNRRFDSLPEPDKAFIALWLETKREELTNQRLWRPVIMDTAHSRPPLRPVASLQTVEGSTLAQPLLTDDFVSPAQPVEPDMHEGAEIQAQSTPVSAAPRLAPSGEEEEDPDFYEITSESLDTLDTEMSRDFSYEHLKTGGALTEIYGLNVIAYAYSVIQRCPVKNSCFGNQMFQEKETLMVEIEAIMISDESIKNRARNCSKKIREFIDRSKQARDNRETLISYLSLSILIVHNYHVILQEAKNVSDKLYGAFDTHSSNPATISVKLGHIKQTHDRGLADATVDTCDYIRRNTEELPIAMTRDESISNTLVSDRLASRKNGNRHLDKHLKKMALIANSYKPVFAFFGLGREKRLVLLSLANILKDSNINSVNRLDTVMNALSFLKGERTDVRTQNNNLRKGQSLWVGNSRRNSGYRSHISFLSTLCSTLKNGNPSWPSTKHPEPEIYSVPFFRDSKIKIEAKYQAQSSSYLR